MAGIFIFDTLRMAGEFKPIEPHFAGRGQRIDGFVGAEDISIHPQSGVAFISCDDRRSNRSGENKPGAIYSFDLNLEPPQPRNLTPNLPFEFHPHGISLYTGAGSGARLFVVNHRAEGHFIEIFDLADSLLVHRDSISGPLMHSPNDVVAVGPRQFYVTNDHGSTSRLGRTLEEFLRLSKCTVLYYDGAQFSVAANGIRYANGINCSPDGRQIYVASVTKLGIEVYHREPASGALTQRAFIECRFGVDNIEVDTRGNLWIAGHPKILTFVKHGKDANKLAPSQVIKIAPGDDFHITEILMDDGRWISGSSVAAVHENRLLVGSVFDPHILLCEFQ
jgi:arylesterase/paraoxonase